MEKALLVLLGVLSSTSTHTGCPYLLLPGLRQLEHKDEQKGFSDFRDNLHMRMSVIQSKQ
eukprot:1550634-Amphidinium_carterae.1